MDTASGPSRGRGGGAGRCLTLGCAHGGNLSVITCGGFLPSGGDIKSSLAPHLTSYSSPNPYQHTHKSLAHARVRCAGSQARVRAIVLSFVKRARCGRQPAPVDCRRRAGAGTPCILAGARIARSAMGAIGTKVLSEGVRVMWWVVLR